jgi:drug/metabolite transporter (DMT)-like permease
MQLKGLSRHQTMFVMMSAIWGTTWIAIKIGVTAVPPVLFAGTRFAAAGLLLLAWRALWGSGGSISPRDWPRFGAAAFLMVTATYAPLFWAALYVPSGLAAVIDFAFIPIALMGFAILMGEETFDRARITAVGLGVTGIVCLFWSTLLGEQSGGWQEAAGAAAIVLSVAAYCFGSVLARPLLRTYPASLLAGASNLLGGAVLIAGATIFEADALAALADPWSVSVWLSWAFLVLFGSLGAYTMYLLLVRDWGPSRAGSYSFVSPAIAMLLGAVIFGERIGLQESVGIVILLGAAMLAVRKTVSH